MDWARERGMAGMYSEATAAHPYSQRANIELGAHETGFLLGWIPASVSTRVAHGGQSAALFYEAGCRRHEGSLHATAGSSAARWSCASCAGRSPSRRRMPSWRRDRRCRSIGDTNLALLTVHCPGRTWRRRSPPSATTSSTAPASTPSTSTCRWRLPPRRWSPTTWSGSASPTPGSSPTAAPTATCCGCSRCTACESRRRRRGRLRPRPRAPPTYRRRADFAPRRR